MREGEELKAPRHASAAATRYGNLPSRDGSLPYVRQLASFPTALYANKVIAKPSTNLILLEGLKLI